MNILHLSDEGIDRVTLWTDVDHPNGCLVQFQGHPVVYAVASIQPQPPGVPQVGLLEMTPQLYQYLAQELQGESLEAYDFDFISTPTQVFGVRRQGGMKHSHPELVALLNAVEARLHEDNAGEVIRVAIQEDYKARHPLAFRFPRI